LIVATPVTTAVPNQPLPGAFPGPAYTTSNAAQFGQQPHSSWRIQWEQCFPAMLRSCDHGEIIHSLPCYS
jgi:hypothetical protein